MLRKLTFWLMQRNGLDVGTSLDIAEARKERDRWEARCALLTVQLSDAVDGRKDDD